MQTELRDQLIAYIIDNQAAFYRLAYRYVGERETALDVVQSAVVHALEHIGSLRSAEAMRTWFYRIVVNEALTTLRKRSRVIPGYEPELDSDAVYQEPWFEEGQAVAAAVDALPEPTRTVITLSVYEELTFGEIAQVTKTKISTVKYRYYAGIKRLKEELK